jgi:hypothetical protein
MRAFKIILGFLFLYSTGKEYINAGKQLFTFLDPLMIILTLLMLVLCAWLIGSGVSNEKLKIKSWKFAGYYGASFAIFLLVAFLSIFTHKFDPEIVKVNGIDVDIAEFMNGTKRIVADETERKAYCVCIVTKLTANKEIAEKYRPEFESGKFSKVLEEVQMSPTASEYKLNECLNSLSNVEWTPAFEKGARANMLKQLTELGVDSTNNINKYCDCLIEAYKKIPIQELSSSNFQQSKIALTTDSICNLKSKNK